MRHILIIILLFLFAHTSSATENEQVSSKLTENFGRYIEYIEEINLYKVKFKGKYGLVSSQGDIIVPIRYDYIYLSSYEYYKVFLVKNNNKCGLCKYGEEIIPPTYDDIEYNSYNYNVIPIKSNNYWGVLDTIGNIKLPFEYDTIYYAYSDLICIGKNNLFGYLDRNTYEIVIPLKYEGASVFQKDIARVKINGKWELMPNPRKGGSNIASAPTGKRKAVSTYPAPSSDVDTNIPITKNKAENTFAFIIANENYEVAKVPYALNDGWIFEKYCKQTLGIPENQVYLYEDATGGKIVACLEKLKDIAKAYEGEANIIFYYAGHAFPDEKDNTAYLLPIDGNSMNINTAYSLKRLYQEINSVPTKSVVCLIDACFSGTTREDAMLTKGRGVAIKVKDDIPQGNMIVFTSATGAETAHSYNEKGHGLFTYFLLKELQQTSGEANIGDLTNYVRKEVRKKSVLVNEKMQTPTVIASPTAENWQEWKLK